MPQDFVSVKDLVLKKQIVFPENKTLTTFDK
jgi:hypothetical protein